MLRDAKSAKVCEKNIHRVERDEKIVRNKEAKLKESLQNSGQVRWPGRAFRAIEVDRNYQFPLLFLSDYSCYARALLIDFWWMFSITILLKK